MTTRRECLRRMAGGAGMLALDPRAVFAGETATAGLITRAIPATGERLPIIGLGSSATFAQVARSEDATALRGVLERMVALGGTIVDTAPAYGASEEVAGRIAQDLGIAQQLFWATKLNVASRGGGAADPAAARSQLETSFRRIGKPVIDLVQVHNMGDIGTQLPILRELKEKGRVRYNAEQTILPLARDRGIAVLVYAPFGRTRLWRRVAGRKVPEWAREFDANSWARFFLKYVASHPAVTAITPATSRPANMADNMSGAIGRLPDAAMRRRMIELVAGLPAA